MNDEARMTKPVANAFAEDFVIEVSSLIRHSSFDIRHCEIN